MMDRLLRAAAVLAVMAVGLALEASPAGAAGTVTGVDSITVTQQAGVYSTSQNIHLSSPAVSELRITVPQPLAHHWVGVQYATCSPGFDTVATERLCARTASNANNVISYRFADDTNELVDHGAFTVTVTDTHSNDFATGTVNMTAQADLDLYATPRIVEATTDPHAQVYLTLFNHGPSPARSTILRTTFSGSYTFRTLPAGCSAAGAVVTCALGNIAPNSPRGPLELNLGSAPGSFAVTAELVSPTHDPNPANNVRQTEPFQNLNSGPVPPDGAGSGGSGSGGSSGSGMGSGGLGSGGSATPGSTAGPSLTPAGEPSATASSVARTASAGAVAATNAASANGLWWLALVVSACLAAATAGLAWLRRRRGSAAARGGDSGRG